MDKYIEYLQQRVSNLEELQAADESSELQIDDKSNELKFPKIESRVFEKKVLLKIQCEKGKGNLGKILGELDKFDLAVVNIGVTPFGSSVIDITIIAEMEKEERLSTTDLLNALSLVLQTA
ncbi:basic helix-loop-helix (bHLH) DNA-bindingsuperfamily protein [Striga asiatica]|uniref:Basic helix-loop-helix (BHLH) DNA-bindingsuperfamily protein n=1 Tax=Striga asiatica TaxID=4170 RepID=A0A5A7RCD2_STRAF|nr:basic helix-loop-helix (bHLH) DNA-bindingsuperfamily protein [Striga asiatica]